MEQLSCILYYRYNQTIKTIGSKVLDLVVGTFLAPVVCVSDVESPLRSRPCPSLAFPLSQQVMSLNVGLLPIRCAHLMRPMFDSVQELMFDANQRELHCSIVFNGSN